MNPSDPSGTPSAAPTDLRDPAPSGRAGTPTTTWAQQTGDGNDPWAMAGSLVSATFVWGGIGWLLDRWLGTSPVLMSIGFVVGFFAGMYLLWLKSSKDEAGIPSAALRSTKTEDPATATTEGGSDAAR